MQRSARPSVPGDSRLRRAPALGGRTMKPYGSQDEKKDQTYGIYKDHYACFGCRKVFKQPNILDLPKQDRPRRGEKRIVLCPQCSKPMQNMGHAFKAPRQNATKQWKKVETLFTNGIRFDYAGWAGPGYRPATMREVEPFLDRSLFKTKRQIEVGSKRTTTGKRKAER